MAEVDGQEKTEQPTGKKLQESREKGIVAKSMEINSFAIFGGGMLLLLAFHSYLGKNISNLAKGIFNNLDKLTITQEFLIQNLFNSLIFLIVLIGPLFFGLIVIGFLASVSQFGFKFSTKALAPKFNKFNIFNGIKNLFFSSRAFIETGKSLFKLFIISYLSYGLVKDLIQPSLSMIQYSVPEIVDFMIDSAFGLIWKIGLIYALFAAADFFYQRYKHKKDLMMTKQEVKEEVKQTEGDPQVKGRIRKIMIQMARRRMMQAVPTADVVITNPTHVAVALKYDVDKDYAPKVVAKGLDDLAQKIKKVAIENNIPLYEDVELARALYKYCDIGDFIPQTLFTAVAKILAYIYQLKNSKKKRSIV